MAGAPEHKTQEVKSEHRLGDVVGFSIFIRIPIFIVLALLVVGLSAAYIWLPKNRDAVTFIALALTAAAGIGGTFYLAESLRTQSKQQMDAFTQAETHHGVTRYLELKLLNQNEETKASERRREAFALVARWNSPELFYARQVCQEALEAFRTGQQKGIDQYLADPKKAQNARHVLNLLEEIAIAKRTGHADEEVLSRSFAGLTIRLFKAFEEWIDEHRNTIGRQKIWSEFEALYREWQDR